MGHPREKEDSIAGDIELLLGNLWPESPAVHVDSAKQALDTRIVCITCDNGVALPANFLEQPSYKSHCFLCDQPLSVELIYTNDDMSVLELKGCEYGRPVPLAVVAAVWDNERTKVGSNPFGNDSHSFVDNLLAHWEVRTKAGEVFHFEYFSAIRKWIEEGKLKSDDEIIPADGRMYRLSTYPGTADLFGNIFLRSEARKGMLDRPAVLVPRKPKEKIVWKNVFLMLGLAVVAGLAPDMYQGIRLRTGDRLLHRLVQLEPPVSPERYLTEVLNANDRFHQGTPEELKLAEKSYLRALALKPNDPEVIGGLVETWIQLSDVSSPILATADALLRYANIRYPMNANILRAQARLEHKLGKGAEALAELDRALIADPNDPDTHALLAMIALEQNDYTTATLHLDQSLQIDPTNVTLIRSFVSLFERQSKFREAAEYVKRLASLSGNPDQTVNQLAELYMKANDPAAVESVYREAIQRGKQTERFQAELIDFLNQQKRTDDVVRESLVYLEAYPNGDSSLRVRGFYSASLDSIKSLSSRPTETTSSKSPRSSSRSKLSRRR